MAPPDLATAKTKKSPGLDVKRGPAFKVGDIVQKGNGIKYRVCGYLECREIDREDGKGQPIGYRWILSPGQGVPTFGTRGLDFATADELKLLPTTE